MGRLPGRQRLYKPREAALMLGLTKDALLKHESEGRIAPADRDDRGNRVYSAEDIEVIRERLGLRPTLKNAPLVIAVFNMKGGVGKSTLSSNTAWKLAECGFRVLALDADPQAHMTTSLGLEPHDFDGTFQNLLIPEAGRAGPDVERITLNLTPNLDLVPANLSMCALNLYLFQQPEREYRLRRAMEHVRDVDRYDLTVIDSPPSYDLTSLNILLACDILVAPVKLDGNSFYGLEYLFDSIHDLINTYRYEIPKVLIVPNHYNHGFSVGRQILRGLQKNYGEYMARTVVRQDVNFDKANALREPIFVAAPSSKGSRDLDKLTAELIELIRERHDTDREGQTHRQTQA